MLKKKKKTNKISNKLETINEKEYKETKLEKIDNWLYDHCLFYSILYRFYKNQLSPVVNYYRVKRLFQRLIYGFDDSETWALDWTFYKWLYPRLKRFEKVMQAYPTDTTFEDWKKELKKRIKQLDKIINIDEFDFDDWSYIPRGEMNKFKYKLKHDSNWRMTVNSTAYDYCLKDFNKWFCENLPKLWW